MLRVEFVQRKLQLIADDLARLVTFKDDTLEALRADDIRLAAVERMIERIVLRAVDVNEHLLAELALPEERATRLTYRDTFLMLAGLGVYPEGFATQIAASAGLGNLLVHDYNDVDHSILHSSIKTCRRDYRDYVEYVEAFVTREGHA
jgi:uncharacterized protein YutE (UPF0331/DUF86 family)